MRVGVLRGGGEVVIWKKASRHGKTQLGGGLSSEKKFDI
jgi:hypothetical protein